METDVLSLLAGCAVLSRRRRFSLCRRPGDDGAVTQLPHNKYIAAHAVLFLLFRERGRMANDKQPTPDQSSFFSLRKQQEKKLV